MNLKAGCIRFGVLGNSSRGVRGAVRPAFLLLMALGLLWSSRAFAHDPGLSTLRVRVIESGLEAELTFALADISRVGALAELRRRGKDAIDLKLDGRSLSAAKVECEFNEGRNAIVRVRFNAASFEKISLRSRWLAEMPLGHRQFLTIQAADGSKVAEGLLDRRSDSIDVQLASPASEPSANSFLDFVALGVRHIWMGYDHLLFLFALLIVTRRFGTAVKIISGFTLAHSITLAAATLSPVQLLPASVVEPVIAASIVYVGLENLFRGGDMEQRWWPVFLFGLIHGLGFASVLRELGVGEGGGGIVRPLLAFNIGVELGQVAVAAVVLPVIWKVQSAKRCQLWLVPASSLVVVVLGGYWCVTRIYDL